MKRFATGLFIRIAIILITCLLIAYAWWTVPASRSLLVGVGLILLTVQTANLHRYITSLNRKLTRFMESVRYSDFAVAFKADSELGPSFKELNQQFNEVLEAFRQARAEKEANLHYLNTIVQQVSVGLISFDMVGNVEMTNQAALRLLGIYRLRNLSDLQSVHAGLYDILTGTPSSTPAIYQTSFEQELSVRCATVSLRGRPVTVASIQNIRSELQQKELEAWQNLTKVLRHEIMNSVTPIVSLVGTMQQIVNTELAGADTEAVNDLREALTTIEHRGRGIMRFVDAYRNFTAIPQPRLAEISVENLLKNVIALVQTELQQRHIILQAPPVPSYLMIFADAGQIEMVLINLIKNAMESLDGHRKPKLRLEVKSQDNRLMIYVSDNGPGIEPEAIEKIFIPFYTTKKTGSGIGLSLSRQIMQLHNGQLKVTSTPGQGSTFSMIF
ncbi:sensor histidine kinase [Larkinella humicola]|uniref:histidine kinase n=1 Tax=Larkinella humicola TaxID=2607654 RepID=A0A5N1JH04_9BACT|nr:ATP-binding protein [Larkinella humicola]KAA9354718.1 GHKL domain-containing protein [Larkinella humicola]